MKILINRPGFNRMMKSVFPEKALDMQEFFSNKDLTGTSFGRLLVRKRNKAGLSLSELAGLARLPLGLLEGLENGKEIAPGFDVCYKIAQAINTRDHQGFGVQDFWEASALDKLSLRTATASSQALTYRFPSQGAMVA